MMAKSDLANFAMGTFTSCCVDLYSAGSGAQGTMILHPDCQPYVIKDAQGKINTSSIIYVNREQQYAVANSFEVNKEVKDIEDRKNIYTTAMQGIDAFAKQYNQENPDKPIKKVNCGFSLNWEALNRFIFHNPKSNVLQSPDFGEYSYVGGEGMYSGDWHHKQWELWNIETGLNNPEGLTIAEEQYQAEMENRSTERPANTLTGFSTGRAQHILQRTRDMLHRQVTNRREDR